MKLQQALGDCTLALLRKIAANHGVMAEEDRLRAELAEAIQQRLLEPGYMPDYLGQLSPEEVQLLQLLRDQGWSAKAFVLERRFPRPVPTELPAGRGSINPTLSLLQKGLLFRGFSVLGSWRGQVYYLPEELQPLAELPPTEGEVEIDLRLPSPPDLVSERLVAFDLFCLLSFLRREPRKLVRGSLSRADLAKLEREVTSVSTDVVASRWEERWRFLLHLCAAAGWVRREGSYLRPAGGVDRVLAAGDKGVRRRLLERYLRERRWSDLAAAGKVRQPLGNRQIDEGAARRLLVHHLEEVAGGGWIAQEPFIHWLYSFNPDFLREDYSSPTWAVTDAITDVDLFGPGSWDAVEGEWIRYVLLGPLHWLGTVRWGIARGGKAEGFQWVAPAAEGGSSTDGSREASADGLVITEGLELRASFDGDLGLLYRLEPYLELARRDETSLYRLTRASVLAGLERGGSREELRQLLQRVGSVPAAAVERVDEWASRYGSLQLEGVTVLTAGTEEDAELVPTLPGVADCLDLRLGPRSFRVSPGRGRELVDRLRRAGYPPRVDARAGLQGPRRSPEETGLLREGLFALKLLARLHPEMDLGEGAQGIARLEAALGPEECVEVDRRVEETLRDE